MGSAARVAAILLAATVTANAHDPLRPDLNPWFDKLASGKGLCCSHADGTALLDSDWESKNGHYRVRIEEKWWDVPDEAVVTEPNRDGRTIVWPVRYNNGAELLRYEIRCFLPGSMT